MDLLNIIKISHHECFGNLSKFLPFIHVGESLHPGPGLHVSNASPNNIYVSLQLTRAIAPIFVPSGISDRPFIGCGSPQSKNIKLVYDISLKTSKYMFHDISINGLTAAENAN